MKRLNSLVLPLVLAAGCTPPVGHLSAKVAMPGLSKPATADNPFPSPGITLDPEKEDICGTARVYLYASKDPAFDVNNVPNGVVPIMSAPALGKYTEAKPECIAAGLGVPVGSNYWLVVRFPASKYIGRGGRPSLGGTSAAIAVTGGVHPIRIREKQETQSQVTVDERSGVTDIEAPPPAK
ncbi:MAG: hypothetical protein H0T46_24325 [Deltaproteobacteria bacterium]|nr:hypothetical protein [Deltaproteobacteria bacterium]